MSEAAAGHRRFALLTSPQFLSLWSAGAFSNTARSVN